MKIPADLSHTGERWEVKQVDRCIAALVAELQEAGIDMRGSCCGHGRVEGAIVLRDGSSVSIGEARRRLPFPPGLHQGAKAEEQREAIRRPDSRRT